MHITRRQLLRNSTLAATSLFVPSRSARTLILDPSTFLDICYFQDNRAPIALHPTQQRNAFDRTLAHAHFSGLTRWDPHARVVPDLATEWEHQKQATIWTFKLRHDVSWHDTTRLRAGQITRALQRALSVPDDLHSFQTIGPQISSVSRNGNDSIRFQLTGTFHELPHVLASPHYKLPNPDTAEHASFQEKLNGTGPYRIAQFADQIGTMESAYVRDHWLSKPSAARLNLWRITDGYYVLNSIQASSTAIASALLETGLAPLLAYGRGLSNLAYASTVTHTTPYIVMRHEKLPAAFIAHIKKAYDRTRIEKQLTPIAQTSLDAPLAYWETHPSSAPATDEAHEPRPRISGTFTLHYADTHPFCRALALGFEHTCKESGIAVRLKEHRDTDSAWEFMRNISAIHIDVHRMQPTPLLEAAHLYHPASHRNFSRYNNDAVTTLLEQAWYTENEEQRDQLALQALRHAAIDAGTLFPVLPRYLHPVTPSLENHPFLPFGDLSEGTLPLSV